MPTLPLPPLDEPGDTLRVERRSAERFRGDWCPPVRIAAGARFEPCRAQVRDLSMTGMAVVTGHYLEPGTDLTIELRNPERGFARLLTGQVKRAVPFPEESWLLGCVLANPLEEEDVFNWG